MHMVNARLRELQSLATIFQPWGHQVGCTTHPGDNRVRYLLDSRDHGIMYFPDLVSLSGALAVSQDRGRTEDLSASDLISAANPGWPKLVGPCRPVWPRSHHSTQKPSRNGMDSPVKRDEQPYKPRATAAKAHLPGGRVAASKHTPSNLQAGTADAC